MIVRGIWDTYITNICLGYGICFLATPCRLSFLNGSQFAQAGALLALS